MLEKTLESKLDDYFDIVPKELFEEAQEQAFQEMDADECTEEQCIMMIREILQVENSFQMVLMEEEGDTQISLTWNDLDKKRVEEEYCEGCKTKQLRKMIEGLVEKLVGVKDVVKEEPPKKVEPVVVERPVVGVKKVFTDEPVVQKIEKDKTEGLFVGVGDSGTILTSSDGTTWTNRRDTSVTTEDLYGVTYANGTFVTVGDNIILSSSDGTTWTSRSSVSGALFNTVNYGNGTFVAVGQSGIIYTSSDGITWTSRTSGTSEHIWGIASGNGIFVAVGYSGTILTSPDGTTWTSRTSGTTNNLEDISGPNE